MKLENPRVTIEIEKRTVDKKTGHISFQFRIGPFKKGMATTIGTALRRTLLSISKTVAITSACGDFNDGNSIREDLFELSLNLQRVNIKSSFFPYLGTGRIYKKGPAVITAQDLRLEEGLEVVNPYQYICSINSNYTLDLCLTISSPNLNQITESAAPANKYILMKKNSLKNHENKIASVFESNFNKFFEDKKTNFSSDLRSKDLESNLKTLNTTTSSKTESLSNNIKDYKPKIGPAQKLPLDSILVDPIYTSIQSCGFEIIQTTTSSVVEYDELIRRGVSDTSEFLRFIVVGTGSIEPALAIKYSLEQLRETFSLVEPVYNVFTNQKNISISVEKSYKKFRQKFIQKNTINSYTLELLKELDIKILNLPQSLELDLRREGFVSLRNLISTPLEFLQRIGLSENSLKTIEKSLNNIGLSINVNKDIKWELIPSSLP